MRKLLIVFLTLFAFLAVWFFYVGSVKEDETKERPKVEQSALPTEQFILKHLLAEDGTIRTDFKQNSNGDSALSESMGLWMAYLVEKGDRDQFEKAFQTVQESFLTEDNIIMWKIEKGVHADTNALIDDIRIVEALVKQGEKTGRQDYIKLAKAISSAVLQLNRKEELFVDFYDVNHRYKNDEITLSYLNPNAFRDMAELDLFTDEEMENLHAFMMEWQLDNGFFPMSYQLADASFHYEETINLIDQLYIALHLEQFDIKTDAFYEWMKETFYQENVLYGRYDRESKNKAVDYEAAAVYALAIMYSLEIQDEEFAKDLYDQMITMRTNDTESKYYGGYVSVDATHSFDNLLALLAERKLLNEQIIE